MSKDLNAVATEYLPNAQTELENHLILNWYPQRIIKRFGHVPSLLELGVGHGLTSNQFAKACDRYVVIEGSQIVIDQFCKNNPGFKGEILHGYFEDYRPNRLFDVIVMGFILEHVDDPGNILLQYKNFLVPGGKLYVAVPNAKSLNRRLGLELGKIRDIYELNSNDIAQGHQRQYCRQSLEKEVRDSGYTITHTEGIYLKPLPLHYLKKLEDFDRNLAAMLQVGVDFPDLTIAILVELEAV